MKYPHLFFLIVIVSCQGNFANLDCDYVPQKFVLQRDLQVAYFTNVTRAQDSCANEFSAYGTCCSVESIRAKAANLQASLDNSTQQIKAEFAAFSDTVHQVDRRLAKLVNSREQLSDEAYTSRMSIAKGIHRSRAWFFMKQNFDNSSSQLAAFNASMDTCWPSVSSFRNASFCALCSGRSQAFVTNYAGSQTYRLVASNADCANVISRCGEALRFLRVFSQGLYIYTKHLTPLLIAALGIFSDNHKVHAIRLNRLNEYLTSQRLAENINGTSFNLEDGRAGVCNALLSAGKPTLVEAMAQIFQPNTSYGIYDMNGPLSETQQQAVIATDELEDRLNSGVSNSVGNPITNADSSSITSVVGTLVDRLRVFQMNRRRLQGSDNSYLDRVTLQDYIEELKQAVGGKTLESATLSPTPIITGSDEFGGDLVERYISNQLSVISAFGYQSGTGGLVTRPYDNPPADNPPTFTPMILDPIMLTPSNLIL